MQPHRQLLLAAATALAVTGLGAYSEAPAPAGAQSPATSAAAAANVSDIDITEHVKTALVQAESLKGSDITVVTLKGDVRLIGALANQAQIDDAIRIARAAEGAHTIHDELTIKR